MGSWRRQRGEIRCQEVNGTRSRSRKPPLDIGCNTVPSWEKKFCASIGSVPWRKLLETKKFMYLYDNVVKWNDSAGEEAFHNAKSRFWAKINGLPCDILLPDPDIYIDEVDWSSSIDPDLLLDLEQEPIVGNEDEEVGSLVDCLRLNQSFGCVGWGEAEEDDLQQPLTKASDCADQNVDGKEKLSDSSSSQRNMVMGNDGWNNHWNGSSGHSRMHNHNLGNSYKRVTWDSNARAKGASEQYYSRYRFVRSH